jgi:hypothetical protein
MQTNFSHDNLRHQQYSLYYLQDRKMCVKWLGELSDMKELNGGGPQGALWGILEYLSLSNDLSILEKINLPYLTTSKVMWPQILLKMDISFPLETLRRNPTWTK